MQQREQLLTCPSATRFALGSLCSRCGGCRRWRCSRRSHRTSLRLWPLCTAILLQVLGLNSRRLRQVCMQGTHGGPSQAIHWHCLLRRLLRFAAHSLSAFHLQLSLQLLTLSLLASQLLFMHLLHCQEFPFQLFALQLLLLEPEQGLLRRARRLVHLLPRCVAGCGSPLRLWCGNMWMPLLLHTMVQTATIPGTFHLRRGRCSGSRLPLWRYMCWCWRSSLLPCFVCSFLLDLSDKFGNFLLRLALGAVQVRLDLLLVTCLLQLQWIHFLSRVDPLLDRLNLANLFLELLHLLFCRCLWSVLQGLIQGGLLYCWL
mmetsp:Transcript_62641/g.149415  ORF Transcript_62641/g.149415 Transcript_62641/m.149415 type:complete len:315 (+) Transcript_62641:860-1804(+)